MLWDHIKYLKCVPAAGGLPHHGVGDRREGVHQPASHRVRAPESIRECWAPLGRDWSTRGVINGPSSNDSASNWPACRRFPVLVVLKQPMARQGEKASLSIGCRKNVSEAEQNVLLFSRPFCRANSNRRQNGRGYPAYPNRPTLWPALGSD